MSAVHDVTLDASQALPVRVRDALLAGRLDADTGFDVTDPDDGRWLATLPRQSGAAAEAAVARATLHERGAVVPLHERIRTLREVAQTVRAERDVFAFTAASEGIKTIKEAYAEVDRCVDTLLLSVLAVESLSGSLIPLGITARLDGHFGYFRYGPIGTTVALTPYNDPLNLVAHKLGPAMGAGNPVVLFADQRTPLSALLLCSAFWRAGVSENQLQIVLGDGGTIVPALLTDPRVRAITATGGGRLERAVRESVGARTLILELGGVCPSVVSRDADLDLAADRLAAGAASAAGQNCLHPQIVAVDAPVYERFLAKLADRVQVLVSGNKFDPTSSCGPLIDPSALDRVDELVADARSRGARTVIGGKPTLTPLHRSPSILRDVPSAARLWSEEVFGPVTAVQSVADVDQGLRLVARSGGLQASVFTSSLATVDTALATLRHASVVVNDADVRFDGMPFGGDGSAGLNREGPAFAVKELSSIQSVIQRRSSTPNLTGSPETR